LTNKNKTKINPVLNLGRIQKPHGLKGELYLTSFGSLLNDIKEGNSLALYESRGSKDGFLLEPKFIKSYTFVKAKREKKNIFSLKLLEIETREKAEEIKGTYAGIDLDDAKKEFPIDENEPYLFHYIGLKVKDDKLNKSIGFIKRIEEAGFKKWLIIEINDTCQEAMIPLDGPFVKSLDFKNNEIIMADISEIIS